MPAPKLATTTPNSVPHNPCACAMIKNPAAISKKLETSRRRKGHEAMRPNTHDPTGTAALPAAAASPMVVVEETPLDVSTDPTWIGTA